MPDPHMNIEEFYGADERRRRSAEVEFGSDWHDADGARYELSWVADTGELYIMREAYVAMTEDPFGDIYRSDVPLDSVTVAVVGWVPGRDKLDDVLDGWQDQMNLPNSIAWLAARFRERGVPRNSASG